MCIRDRPVSRSFIEQVRGVDSSSTVQTLVQKGLIEEAGRLDLPGRPVSFRTTDVFPVSYTHLDVYKRQGVCHHDRRHRGLYRAGF